MKSGGELPIRAISAPATWLGSGAFASRRLLSVPPTPAISFRLLLMRTVPCASKLMVSPARTVIPVSVHSCVPSTRMKSPDVATGLSLTPVAPNSAA